MVRMAKIIDFSKKGTNSKCMMSTFRERLHINGLVQGIGFRPFIYRIAKQCNLSGFVNNNSKGVLVEIEVT